METTDFEEWLKGLEIEDHHDVYCMFIAVKDLKNEREFVFKKLPSGNYMLTCNYFDLTLILTEKSRLHFLNYITKKYAKGMDIESWSEMMRLMNKND